MNMERNGQEHTLRTAFDAMAPKRAQFRKKGAYYHRELEKYLRFLIPEGSSVLEVGCATGDSLAALNPSRGVGIDISPNMVAEARARYPHLTFIEADAHHFKLNERFDYVLIMNTLGQAEDIQQVLEQIRPHCYRHTRVIIIYFNWLWRPVLKIAEALNLRMPGHERHWLPLHDMRNMLTLSGFQTVAETTRFFVPLFFPVISWLGNRVFTNLPGISRLALNTILVARPYPTLPKENPTVSVVIPCRNEKGNIEAAVQRTPKMGAHTELIFVEGGSKDGTYEECLRVQAAYPDRAIKVLKQPGKGKGDAVRAGYAAASGDIYMILDADLTVPPEDLPKFFDAIATGKGEFINGSRLVYNMEEEAMRPLNLLGNKFFSVAFSFLLNQKFRDTLCGTKVLWAKDYKRLEKQRSYFGDFDPFGDFDLLFGASKLQLKILEVPIRYRSRVYGETQISRFTHGWMLLKMVAYAARKLKLI
jgi:SAM-dependent methyltransferase